MFRHICYKFVCIFQLHEGKVRLAYNLGDGEKTLDLTHAHANNGQWHTLLMQRFGREFHLKLDGGEGVNYNYTLGGTDRHRSISGRPLEREVLKVNSHVYSGALKEGIGVSATLSDDLVMSKLIFLLMFIEFIYVIWRCCGLFFVVCTEKK